MIEKISLRLFWTLMLLCALTALFGLWTQTEPGPIFPSLFITGFASFLIWAPLLAYRFLAALERRENR